MANSKRRCLNCKGYFAQDIMISTPVGWFDSHKCLVGYAQAVKTKSLAKRNREQKERLKSYSAKLQVLQKDFNWMRRAQELLWFAELGLEPYCISCLKPLGNDQWCCGHLKTTKARSDLRFDPVNTYLQHNVRCNRALSGDIENYKLGLAHRFGDEESKRILDYVEQQKPIVKMSDDEIKAAGKHYRAEARRAEKRLAEINLS